jgi:hypothetical protein
MSDEQVIVGEVEAGRAAKIRREIAKLVKGVNTNTFDLAEKLWEVKTEQYFTEYGFESFSKFCKDIADLKYSKSYYLVAIVTLMRGADISRTTYEPVGLGKLRVISRLKLEGEFHGVPMVAIVKELTLKAASMSLEEVQFEVDTILGLTEDESMVWMNFHLKKLARENAVKPAIALAKKFMPESQTKDEDGNYVDPSDGAALEMIAANFLSDPNFNPSEPDVPTNAQENIEQEIADLEQNQ